ncbi:MFS transporter [Dactylosporangium sp. NPDC051485]|uniref:MFS transporter n=1 Tax=Dactylosporangium sp. NPDC051485 TaxID=3154846 RepID=UPI0034150D40
MSRKTDTAASAGTSTERSAAADADAVRGDPRRWKALIVLALVSFVQVVDVTVVNVALPRIQHDLSFSQTGLAWVVNAYVLIAGGFLLLGGRLADLFGRRRLFMIGVAIFAVASATCGAANSAEMLVASRFVQGLGEALAAPAALGLIALLFTDKTERNKALGIWGGVAGLAGVSGVVISGLLTDLASWRWIFYINIPIAVIALLAVPRLVSESRMARTRGRVDLFGAVTATAGLVAIVYGLLQAAEHAWGSTNVLLPLGAGVLLLLAAALIESRSSAPLIPLSFFQNRTRVTANIAGLLFTACFMSYIFLLTLYLQEVLEFSPLHGGLSYLPFGLSMGVGIGLGAGLMQKVGVKAIAVAGYLLAAVGLFLTSMIDENSSYASGVLPGMIIFGIASGMITPAITNASLHGVTGQDAGLASGVQQTLQQTGQALGLAALITFALRHAADQVHQGAGRAAAAADGYALSLRIAAGIVVVAAIAVVLLLNNVGPEPRNAVAEADVDEVPAVPAPADGTDR